ncbi:MAG: EAL domain-containing protein, partial [Cyanobacteria bacterium]|nr:EAL domain-containing protein [Cyanobacteriota bacterium]
HNLPNDARNQAIVTAVIQMAHNLNLQVIAEGVETEQELAFLRHHHCDAMQGFLFSRPLPTSDFEALITTGKTLLRK